ncbi:MAG: hypothetical protein KC731_01945, partial [Myxococcales bacterium]|nr:hypothetical protein [Myxococcales bacterium]
MASVIHDQGLFAGEEIDNTAEAPGKRAELVLGGHTLKSLTAAVVSFPERDRAPRAWWIALAISATVAIGFFSLIGYLIATGVGVWGNNSPVGWAWPIVNFV